MNNAQTPILDLARRQGLLRPRDVEAYGFSRMALSTLARQGKLTRLCRGGYPAEAAVVAQGAADTVILDNLNSLQSSINGLGLSIVQGQGAANVVAAQGFGGLNTTVLQVMLLLQPPSPMVMLASSQPCVKASAALTSLFIKLMLTKHGSNDNIPL